MQRVSTWSRDPSEWNFTKTIFVLGKCGGDQWHWMEDRETLMGMARQDGGRCSVAVRAPVRNMKSKHLHLLATWRHTPEVNLRFHCSFFLVSSMDDTFHSRSWFDAIRFVIAYTVDLRALPFVWANIYYTFQVSTELKGLRRSQVVETMTVLLSQWLATSNFTLF